MGTLQPAHHRRHPDDADRARRGQRLRQDRRRSRPAARCRHVRQLLGRRDPLGHRALRRGELPRLLRRRRGLTAARPGGRRPDGPLRRVSWNRPSQVGDVRPPFRPGRDAQRDRTGSVTSSRSTRGTRPRRRSSTPRWDGSSTRAPPSTSPTTARVVAYTGDDERFDYMYKFVSRKKMQPGRSTGIRGDGAQPDPARRGHAVRRQTLQRHPAPTRSTAPGKLPAEGSFAGTGTWIPLLRSGPGRPGRVTGRRHHRAGGRGVHPAGRRQGRCHQDGPARGLRGQPEDRQGVRRADQQRRARRRRARPRPTPPTRATTTRAARSSRSPTTTPAPTSPGTCCWSAAIPAAADTYFGGFDKTKVSPISCPDNLAFDSHGNLWISTDGNALDSNDGLFAVALDGPEPR